MKKIFIPLLLTFLCCLTSCSNEKMERIRSFFTYNGKTTIVSSTSTTNKGYAIYLSDTNKVLSKIVLRDSDRTPTRNINIYFFIR